MENQRTLLYISLAMLLFLLWGSWQQDYGPQPEQVISKPSASNESSAIADDIPGAAKPPATDLPAAVPMTDSKGMPIMSAIADKPGQQRIHIETDKLIVELDSRGGNFSVVKLRDYPQNADSDEPFLIMGGEFDKFSTAQSGLVSAASQAPSHHTVYHAEKTAYKLEEGQNELQVNLFWQSEKGDRFVKTIHFKRGSYEIDISHKVTPAADWNGSQYSQLIMAEPQSKDNQFIYTYTGGVIYNDDFKYSKVEFSDMANKSLDIDSSATFKAGWAAMIQHYFLASWVPGADENNFYYTKQTGDNRYMLGLRSAAINIKAGETGEFNRKLVVGPKLQHQLEKIAPGLELTVDYGFLTIIAKPLFWLLEVFYDFFGNWGWAIIFLTITVKLIFYKLSEASYRSMAKMRKLGPRLKSLKERFGDDRQAMSKAMMEMYKTEKINPLGGCFPMLVQIPVFIALYWVLLESVEMRNAPFALWLDNLSEKDPYFVLPLLMGISMFVQFKLNPAPMDPIQKKVFQFMPIIFTVFFAFFPSGLVLYWVVNNILSITQQYIITKRIEAGAEK
ncbi:MAG: membrane protein insertase YidC [Gammaproteobacteria bacterium]|nr:membrane protein insertase YidC [Gammaproteobacteria bacterium]